MVRESLTPARPQRETKTVEGRALEIDVPYDATKHYYRKVREPAAIASIIATIATSGKRLGIGVVALR